MQRIRIPVRKDKKKLLLRAEFAHVIFMHFLLGFKICISEDKPCLVLQKLTLILLGSELLYLLPYMHMCNWCICMA